ncbi:MAG: hypothetical protein GX419_09690 [Bacteroidales bacterium]|nr:hypothetical protein [Bacteroidales bacterium]
MKDKELYNYQARTPFFRSRGKILVFLFFFFLSFLFWLLNALNKEYSVAVKYAVRFAGYPANYVLVSDTPYFVNALIRGRGYDLLWPLYGTSSILRVNLEGTKVITDGSDIYKFSTNDLKRRIQELAGDAVQISGIWPDTLYLSIAPVIVRKIAVKPAVRATFARQYMLCQPLTCIPDSVTVTGASRMVDTMQCITTRPLTISSLKKSFSEKVQLAAGTSVKCEPEQVQIAMEVDKFTETSLRVPVKVINLNPPLRMKIFPAEVTLSFRVCLNHYKELSPQSFSVAVDYRERRSDTTTLLPVHILQKPDFTDNILITPSEIEFILE